jgi:DNA-binding SARP family transcriptional activator
MASSVEDLDQQPISIRVLGPIAASAGDKPIALKGPMHKALLARLIVARGQVVSVDRLVDDLWPTPPRSAVGAIRTFVADLRQALEPGRPPRAPARRLVTEGPGYALRTTDIDAHRFEAAVETAAAQPAESAAQTLTDALKLWRGAAYQELADHHWTRPERARLTELRLQAIERRAEALLKLGHTGASVIELDAHVAEHPWREDGWRLLALALYRSERQADALATLRRARAMLAEHLGVDPGPALQRLERDILNHTDSSAERVFADAAQDYARTVGARARLESTVNLLRELAVSGGLEAARTHRLTAIRAAEELGDPNLTARVIGAYDVPAIWTRSDDPAQAAAIVDAAQRTLPHIDDAPVRARLLATIALESRGTVDRRAEAAEAERLARHANDPRLLAFALNGVYMQSCHTLGNAPARDGIGRELVALATSHDLPTFEVLGHLIRVQANCALGDFDTADVHADAADELNRERPLIAVFTTWYRALKQRTPAAYERAARLLEGAGMPGLNGLPELAQLSLGLRADAGPFEPIDPRPDLLQEALWCVLADRALAAGDEPAMRRAYAKLEPAQDELAAGSGMVSFGSIRDRLDALRR